MTENQKNKIFKMRLEGSGYREIASALFLSLNTVKSYCRRNGLGGYGKVVKLNHEVDVELGKVCKRCGKRLVHTKGKRKKIFCSDYCRKMYWRSTTHEVSCSIEN